MKGSTDSWGRRRADQNHDVQRVLGEAFNEEQQTALATIWGYNADRLEIIFKWVKIGLGIGFVSLVLLACISVGSSILGINNADQHHKETISATKQAAAAGVKAQYAAAYRSCLTTDGLHDQAITELAIVLKHPTKTNISDLVNTLRPDRASDAPPPPKLPPSTEADITGCEKFAEAQINATLPPNVRIVLTTTNAAAVSTTKSSTKKVK